MFEFTMYVILINLIACCGVKLLEALGYDDGMAYEICGFAMQVFFPITLCFTGIASIELLTTTLHSKSFL